MGKNFMEAGTEIEATIEKINQCLSKTANTLATACVDRTKTGNVGRNMPNDILKLIETLPSEQQVQVLAMALATVCSSFAGSSNGSNKSSNRNGLRSDYFSGRGL